MCATEAMLAGVSSNLGCCARMRASNNRTDSKPRACSGEMLVLSLSGEVSDGTRRVISLTEILDLKRKQFQTQEIFRYERQGIDANDRVIGRFRYCGVRPRFADRLAACGLNLPPGFFDEKSG